MGVVRKINDELAIVGEVTLEQLQQVAQEEFRSVLDLRLPNKNYYVDFEQHDFEQHDFEECDFEQCDFEQHDFEQHDFEQYGKDLNLCYVHSPINIKAMNLEVAAKILQHIDKLPKPTLVHCSNAMLAAAMVLMYIAVHQGATLQQAFTQAEQMGLFRSPSFTLGKGA